MTKLALRGLAARRLRSSLTAIAIVLGVAMVAGTYVLTDQISRAFDDIQAQSVEGLDVVISPRETFTASFTEPPTLPAKLVRRVEKVQGVSRARGVVSASGQVIVHGEPLGTGGAPSLVVGYAPEPFNPTQTVSGKPPTKPGEVALLEQTADEAGLGVGDTAHLATRRGVKSLRVVGTIAFGKGGSSLGGTSIVVVPQRQVQSWFGLRGKASAIDVVAKPGVDPERLVGDLRAVLPHDAKVQTAEQNARQSANEINDAIGGFLTPALLAFSGAALLVGAFIIFNTFSITVAQRRREFAVLRSLGATRRQVLAAVTSEALLLGVGASVVGIGAGVAFARLMSSVFDAVGFGIPRSGTVIEPRTVIVALAVGVVVTLVAALAPALRATRVPPVLALAEEAPGPSLRSRRWTAAIAALLSVGGVALLLSGLFGGGAATARLGSIAGGAVLIFIGVALSARYIVRPLASAIGLPIEALFHTPGRLARENSMRNPARTAVTSAALMVGLGLVVFVAVFAAGLKSSFSRQIDELVKSEIIAYSSSFTPIPARTEDEIGSVRGVGSITSVLFDQMEVNGQSSNTLYDLMLGVNPRKLTHAYTFDWVDGSDALLGKLGRDRALVEEQFVKAHKIGVGDSYRVVTPSGGHARITAIGIYRDPTILQGTIVDTRTLRAISPARDPTALFISVAPGADPTRVQARVEDALKRFPEVTVDDRAEYKQYIDKQLNQIVYLVYALLGMSVIVSLFGIANSLFLTIHERTREFGLLRAVGATAGQLRRVVRYESVITAVIGGLMGTALGIAFASVTIASLSEFGLGFALPVGQLIFFALLAVVVGVIGAIGPARRGSRVDVLEAIHHE